MNKKLLVTAILSSLIIVGCSKKENNETLNKEIVSQTQRDSNSTNDMQNEKEVLFSKYSFEEGKHYTVLKEPLEVAENTVTEFFWLGCPHCQDFEPIIKEAVNSNDKIILDRVHAALGDRWALDARIYYALVKSGNEKYFDELFALYKDLRLTKGQLPELKDLEAFFNERNINTEEFFELADSGLVLEEIQSGLNEMLSNEITGVPSIVVNGKYLVKSPLPENIKNQEDYNILINYLLTK